MVALIMAGGKGERIGGKTEKPLIKLLGKPMIRWVIEATIAAQRVSEVYVVATNRTAKTVEEVSKTPVKIIKTDGKGYHTDLQQAILDTDLKYPVLVISADMPLLTGEYLDKVISHYWKAGKPALTVLVPIEACRRYGVDPTSLYPFEGKSHAVSGLNIVDGRKILEGEQEQEVLISDRAEVAINVNTRRDLEAAEKYLREKTDMKGVQWAH
jgi:adenosylcobinamide-phosphate guanylyltransferase